MVKFKEALNSIKDGITKRIIPVILSLMVVINLFSSVFMYGEATAYSTIGTNKALGSPLLNQGAVSDNWNKYETIVWGIFLSNFCTPFIDDYESAFNLGSPNGSHGAGTQALCFGSGNDISTNSTIQDLTSYAINNQTNSMKRIQVSYNVMINGEITGENLYTTENKTAGTPATPPDPNAPYVADEYAPATRAANLGDLFVSNQVDGDDDQVIENTTWAAFTPGYGEATNDWVSKISKAGLSALGYSECSVYNTVYTIMECNNYRSVVGVNLANLPTFAVKGNNNEWEVVFDFRNSYDVQMISAAITYALTGEHSEDVLKFFTDATLNEELWLDSYGNIVAKVGSRYVVIIPASANQYLKGTPSINLVNSLIFNASNSGNDPTRLTLRAGQAKYDKSGWDGISTGLAQGFNLMVKAGGNPANLLSGLFKGDIFQDKEENIYSGSLAFTNDSSGMQSGGCVLFYDTDTIVVNAAKKDGYIAEYSAGGYSNKSKNDVKNGIGLFDVNYGQTLKTLYDLDINDESNKYQFKIEPVNVSEKMFEGIADEKKREMVRSTVEVGSSLINLLETNGAVPRLTSLIDYSSGGKIELFSNPIVVPVQVDDGIDDTGKYNSWAVYRSFQNYLYKVYTGEIKNTSLGSPDRDRLVNALNYSYNNYSNTSYNKAGKLESFLLSKELIFSNYTDDTSTFSDLALGFIGSYPHLYNVVDSTQLKQISASSSMFNVSGPMDMLVLKDIDNVEKSITPKFNYSNKSIFGDTLSNEELANFAFGRMTKVYYTSGVLSEVCNVLGIREGTDFGVFSPNIYLTYLDWYGLEKNNLTGEFTSELNTNIYTDEQMIADISNVTNVVSKEDKQTEILNYSYLMLHPTAGREYRSQINMSNLADALYEQYQRFVYGSASSYYYKNYTTRSNTGFLSIENYAENFMTSWFMSNYVTLAMYIIGLGVIVVILISVLKKRRLSWTLLGILVVINVVLILPATGEIVPYVGNRVVQSIFDDKMTYWSLSEQITNATMESDAANGGLNTDSYGNNLTLDEQKQVISLVKQVKTIYKDRYLSVRQDISNKITSTDQSNFEEIQSLTSARWMLPMIVREFTADNGSADYVYVPLGDKLDNVSNMYWYYKSEDAMHVQTVAAKNTDYLEYSDEAINDIDSDGRAVVWPAYTDLELMDALNIPNGSGTVDRTDYRSAAYTTNPGKLPHTYFYLLDNTGLAGDTAYNITTIDPKGKTFNAWAEELAIRFQTSVDSTEMRKASNEIQTYASGYDASDRKTVHQSFGFLWNTENPLHYFYETVKDTFQSSYTMGGVIGDIQGSYKKDLNTGKEYRNSFMHDDTGNVRDILDLECMFRNVIPYMYSIQIASAGYDGNSGVFGNEKIVDYEVYNKNNISWLFRSNWITKIIENKDYNKSSTISYFNSDGKVVNTTVDNMLFPWCYEAAGREMVFSEAQMHQMGLDESNLSLVELKCVQINKDTSKQWTLLLNYASTPGVTKEVLLRQMAVDGLMQFNSEFSPVGITNSTYALYPTSLNLRSISFDSVMCMLMLNVTHNTSYVYGDTMETLIENSDIFTCILLLLVAILCTTVIPLIRCVTMGLLFYLGYFAVLRALFRDTKEKVQVSCGYLACHILYLIANIVYLMLFKVMMAVTTSDEVLTMPTAEINAGNPAWCLVLILIISIIFVVISWKMIVFCIKNYKDMGMAAIQGTVEMVALNVSSGFEKLIGKLTDTADMGDGISGDPSEVTPGRGKKRGAKRTGGTDTTGSGGSSTTQSADIDIDGLGEEENSQPFVGALDIPDSGDSTDIDKKIAKGKKMDQSKTSDTIQNKEQKHPTRE